METTQTTEIVLFLLGACLAIIMFILEKTVNAMSRTWVIVGYAIAGLLLAFALLVLFDHLRLPYVALVPSLAILAILIACYWRTMMRIKPQWPWRMSPEENDKVVTKDTKGSKCVPYGDNISAFFTTRTSMLKSPYGGIFKELETSRKDRDAYAAWQSGQVAKEIIEKGQHKKIAQLILLHPWNKDLEKHVDGKTWNVSEARTGIVQATRIFQESGILVRWFDGPFSNITIIDRSDPVYAHVRVEPCFVLTECAKWQNYVIYQKDNLDAYNTIVELFKAMWEDKKWTMDAPTGGELEKYRQEKPEVKPKQGQEPLSDAATLHLQLYGDERIPTEISNNNVWRWYCLRHISIPQGTISTEFFLTFDRPVKVGTLEVHSPDFRLPINEVKDFNNRSAVIVFYGGLPMGTLEFLIRNRVS